MAEFNNYHYNSGYISCKTTDENGNLVLEETEILNRNTSNMTYFKTRMVFSSTFIKATQTREKVNEGKTSEILSCRIDKNKIGSLPFNKHDNSAYYWFKISGLNEEDNAMRFNILVNEEIKSEILKFLNDNNITSSQAIEDKITAKFREAQIKLQKEEDKKAKQGCLILLVPVIIILLLFGSCVSNNSTSRWDSLSDKEKQWYKDNYGNGKSDAYDKAIEDYKN